MPLTAIQSTILKLLAVNRNPHSYLAGGATILISKDSYRYSHDLDLFHDSVEFLRQAYDVDRSILIANGYQIEELHNNGTYIQAVASSNGATTTLDWAVDSSWRFMPVQHDDVAGYKLHPVDVATNKVLALAGRDIPRDVLDTLYLCETVLELGPLLFAAVGKDPGYNPLSLLEALRRGGRIRPEMLAEIHPVVPIDLASVKERWVRGLDEAEDYILRNTHRRIGCLYYSPSTGRFVNPEAFADAIGHEPTAGGQTPEQQHPELAERKE